MPDATPARASRLPLLVAVLVAAAGVGWRVVDIAEWPFPFHTSVQYDAALAARSLWVAASPAARTPDRAAWFATVRFEHVISPPLLPAAVAGWYCVSGEEQPGASKAFTAAAWVAACGFVGAAVIRQTGCLWAGVVAGGWLTFAPYGLMVCRCFAAEPVAVLGLAVAVWCLARPGRQLTWRESLAAALACGLAAATKPGVLLPPLAAGFAGAVLSAGVAGSLSRRAVHTVAFAALLAVPSVAYVMVWLPHRGSELRPGLLADPAFYVGVAEMVRRAVGWPVVAVWLAGTALAARRGALLPAGLAAGYVGYVGLFTYHCSTHDYYHVLLFVPAALGLGWVAASAVRVVEARAGGRAEAILAAVVIVGLAGYAYGSRHPTVGPWRAAPAVRAALAANEAHDRERAARFRVVRDVVGPGGRVMAVTEEFGGPLEYHAGVQVMVWQRGYDLAALGWARNPAAWLDQQTAAGFTHLVVTDLEEFERNPDLRAEVERRGRLVADAPGLQVYDLRR